MYLVKFAKDSFQLAMLICICLLQTFSFAQGIWTQKAIFPGGARQELIGLSINGKGYIGTGWQASSPIYKDWWEYDPVLDSWTQKASIPTTDSGYRGGSGFVIGNDGYICVADSAIIALWKYDVTLNSWMQKASFPQNTRIWCSAFSIGNKGYLGLGNDGSGMYSDFYEYDSQSDSWSQIAFFGGGNREDAFAFTLQNKGYVGGGSDGSVSKNDFWVYDPLMDAWTQKANIVPSSPWEADAGFAISTINKGFMKRGFSFSMYDPNTNSWSVKATYPGDIAAATASFSIGSKGYIACGATFSANYSDKLWEYTPDTASGIKEIENLTASIYPNPSSGNFSITINEKEFNVIVYDVTGKVVYESQNEKQINLTDKPKGIYFLKITSDNKIYSQKIIIQ